LRLFIEENAGYMATISKVNAEELAKVFHQYRQALATDFHEQATQEADLAWEQAPPSERRLIIASAHLTLLELAANAEDKQATRQYLAKPGEADWGC
jgi:hypothetical protein